jgi:peptidoglycan/xylan/chitin deacetylase (PgdA/CDA1 family)
MNHSKKQLLLQTLYESGMLRLLIYSQQHKVTILMLHGVINPNIPSAWKPLRPQLTTEQLSQALSILSRYYQFISLKEASEMLSGTRPMLSNSLVLTFDDGYRNNLTFALPILRQFKAPATIFLCTGNVTEQKPFWFDRLDYAVQSMNKDTVSRHKIDELKQIDFSTREALSRSFLTFLCKEKKRYTTDVTLRAAMANLSERMEQQSGHGLSEIFADDPWSGILSWKEIQQVASEVDFGSHGVNHVQLGLIPLNAAKQELIISRETIEFYTSFTCRHLAYPNGSYNDEIITLAKNCHYSSAVTTNYGLNTYRESLLALRRLPFPRTHSSAGVISAASGLTTQLLKIANKITY